MAPKTIKAALVDALEDLSTEDMKKFVHKLLDRREEPRVKRNRVDGKDRLDVVDVMVATFTEEPALKLALDILRDICCQNVAERLREATAGLTSKPADNEHFVDKHRRALIERISNIDPILDQLLGSVIQHGAYDRIRAQLTTQDKVRELFKCLRAGPEVKDRFYTVLQEEEGYLIRDLQKQQ
ncbi:apoptosis-associated speck-like protein containing a CARD isoform X4 [Parambassis ranga]|uniref:Apoptosis-associated speck-like protein containing a CARD isoform X4 n=1 Tax=Parambassis ranga TaxID=210632 RepID=A0A6P7K3G7_9TELE|nr:apoptosis-associated speck-like protein containing a CARD isoform X5 [Parambassis ranga]XP_028282236.1 apoptosis-associated speck-like protein containing a CARD isoform X4 [Parambassis ranga]